MEYRRWRVSPRWRPSGTRSDLGESPTVEVGIREAATVIVARESARGPEILVLERAAGQRFLPGYVAFPGGAVDAGDQELAARWFGDEGEAARATAVRELAEEAGLAITAEGSVSVGSRDPLELVSASPPPANRLVEIARWIAPERVPVRFDARFFAVRAEGGLEPAPDGAEAARAWWASPAELLDGFRSGTSKLYWPTYFTTVALEGCSTVAELLALRLDTREPAEAELQRLPRSTFWQA
jgi:8-oxo-dGTP pyrophosphatase MutT (NUDIX family)